MKYYSEAEARELVIKAGHMLLEKKLIARTWGNISARISEDEFIITPSGRGYDSLAPEDLVIVKVKDGSYEGGIKPSSEKGIHAAAYGLRKELCFVIHTHQYYASALAAECRDTRFAPCAEYGLPGTGRLRNNVETKIRQHPDKKMFLMARHGALLLGKSLEEAFELAEQLEAKSRELVEARIPDHDPEREGMIDADAVRTEAFPCVTVVRDRYIMECCRAGITVAPFIDDFAQIVGPDMQVVANDVVTVQRALLGYSTESPSGAAGGIISKIPLTGALNRSGGVPMTGALNQRGGVHPVLNRYIGRNAVLVKGVGAVCAGRTKEDVEAAAMIVSKNCLAACYVRKARPLSKTDARLQRYIYLASYSGKINDR